MICYLLALPIAVVGFVHGGRYVVNFAAEALATEPIDMGERFYLEVLSVSPGTASSDEFVLAETVQRLGKRIVVAVAGDPNRGRAPISARRSV